MLVHGSFCLSASVGFKFDLNSNRFELFRIRNRKRKRSSTQPSPANQPKPRPVPLPLFSSPRPTSSPRAQPSSFPSHAPARLLPTPALAQRRGPAGSSPRSARSFPLPRTPTTSRPSVPKPSARSRNPASPDPARHPLPSPTARPHWSSPSPRPPLAQRPLRVTPQSSPEIPFPNYTRDPRHLPFKRSCTPAPSPIPQPPLNLTPPPRLASAQSRTPCRRGHAATLCPRPCNLPPQLCLGP